MDIPKDYLDAIKRPNLTLKTHLRVTMDDGTVRTFPAYRC